MDEEVLVSASIGSDRETVYEKALQAIYDRFKDKLPLHKEDCFAYQVAAEALGEEI